MNRHHDDFGNDEPMLSRLALRRLGTRLQNEYRQVCESDLSPELSMLMSKLDEAGGSR